MKYRVLGRTGLKVSEMGIGGHEYRRPLPAKWERWGEIDNDKFMQTQPQRTELIKKALEAGINFFDTTHVEEAKSFGLAMRELKQRSKFHVSIMLIGLFRKLAESPRSEWRDLVAASINEKLRLIHSDYADIATILFPEKDFSKKRLEVVLECLLEFKHEGKISFVGCSGHDLGFYAEIIKRFDCFDMVMVPYNIHEPHAKSIIFPLAKKLNVGVVAIKALTWPYYGIPFMRFGPVEGEEGQLTPAQTSLRWVLRSPEVSTIVVGMNSLSELEENLGAFTEEAEANEQVLERYLRKAQSPEGKALLRTMLRDTAVDIQHFAHQALHRS